MFLPYPVLKYTFVMHVIVFLAFFMNLLIEFKASRILPMIIPRKSRIDQPKYQNHAQEQL